MILPPIPYVDLGFREGAFPVAERIARQELSLPIHPLLSESKIERVVAALVAPAITG